MCLEIVPYLSASNSLISKYPSRYTIENCEEQVGSRKYEQVGRLTEHDQVVRLSLLHPRESATSSVL